MEIVQILYGKVEDDITQIKGCLTMNNVEGAKDICHHAIEHLEELGCHILTGDEHA